MGVFFNFGILNFMKVMLYLQNFIRILAQTCHFPFSTNIQFTLILLLLLILDNDIHQNPGPHEYEFSVFHLNARSVRNKLSYLEDIAKLKKIARAKKSSTAIHKYKSHRNKVNNMIKYAREQFFFKCK